MVSLDSKNLFDQEINDIDLVKRVLSEFLPNKKVFIFVNVACECGLTTSNYAQLVKIYQEYSSKGLEIFAFPCNQFGKQEPKEEADIKSWVTTTFSVTFPLFSKIEVNGENTHPIYKYLKSNSKELNLEKGVTKDIKWNFAKFLVDANGQVLKYYEPLTEPSKIVDDFVSILN